MPVALMGFGTRQSVPLRRIGLPRRRPSPSCRNRRSQTSRLFPDMPCLPWFACTGLILSAIRSCATGISLQAQPMLCGHHPLQGALPFRLRERLRVLFLLRTSGSIFPERKILTSYHRVSKSEKIGLSRRDRRPSWGFALVVPHEALVSAQPWLMDSPPGTGYVTAPWLPDFGLRSHRPECLMTTVSGSTSAHFNHSVEPRDIQ
jgi:hypothetical protein